MEPITTFAARVIALPAENVDTDQIIPARFLKTTDKVGLGAGLFYDWRYDAAGNPRPEFPLNRPEAAGAGILLAGDNFGCGSSREHAPWALLGFGFRAVVSTSFADIFGNNCLKNGLLPIIVDRGTHAELFRLAVADPALELRVDLAAQTLTLPKGRSVSFPIDGFSKQCLLAGVDQLGYLVRKEPQIAVYEASRPSRVQTR